MTTRVKAKDVMTITVTSVNGSTPFKDVAEALIAHGVSAVPVVDAEGHVIGVVSEADLLRKEELREQYYREGYKPPLRVRLRHREAGRKAAGDTVADVMTTEVVAVTETTDATTAIDPMVTKRIKSLPVQRGEKVVGIISRRDLMAMLARPDEELREAVMVALHEQYPFGPSWQVSVHDGIAVLSGKSNPYADGIADVIARTIPGIVRVKHRSQP